MQGDEVDQAINMYKKVKLYDQMIRLVTQYRKENLIQVGCRGHRQSVVWLRGSGERSGQ